MKRILETLHCLNVRLRCICSHCFVKCVFLSFFQLIAFFSDTCGVVGLWFGITVMTFFEFLEVIADLVVMTSRRLANGTRRA